ncbi:MAG: translation elongation factor Ts [Fibrobacterota bacterium]
MANITASMVKELREKTGVGMMACKKALKEAGGDLETAVENLRKMGQAKAEKRSERSATEGRVSAACDEKSGIIFQLNCETDFVTKNADFKAFLDSIQEQLIAEKPANLASALELKMGADRTVRDSITDLIAKIGEKISLSSYDILTAEENEGVYAYVHNNGKVGALVKLKSDSEDLNAEKAQKLGKNICMHIAASNPLALDRDGIAEETIEKEKAIFRDQVLNEGKPEKIADKIVMGKMNKYYKMNTLLEQEYILADKQSVEKAVKEAGDFTITDYKLVNLGE